MKTVSAADAGQVVIGGDLQVNRVGLGTNRIQNDERSKSALRKAVELGINFIDTASAYTGGVSEKVIGETLSSYENLVIVTKGGMVAPDFHVDSRPETLRKSLDDSLKKLQRETIDLYFLHRVDPRVPLKESVLFLKQMQEEGKIKHIGLSEVTVEQIEEARKYIDVVAVENEYNLSERKYDEVIDYCEKENIVFVPFFPLHFDISNEDVFTQLLQRYQATPAQIAIAWLLKRSPITLPIPGSLSPTHLEENAAAIHIQISDEDFEILATIAT
jgi:pyridoxine 4-dehydrogenase